MSDRSVLHDLARKAGLTVISDGVDDLIRSSGAFIRVTYGAADKVAAAFFNDIIIIDDVATHSVERVKSWITSMSRDTPKTS